MYQNFFEIFFLQLAEKSLPKFFTNKKLFARLLTRITNKGILPSKRYHAETEKKYNESSDWLTIMPLKTI